MLGVIGRSKNKGREEAHEEDQTIVDTATFSFTGKVAGWSARRRWWVVAASVVVLVLAVMVSSGLETELLEDYSGEGEASIAMDLVIDRFDVVAPPTEQLVFNNPTLQADDPTYQTTVQSLANQLRALPEVASVVSYYDTQSPGMVSTDDSAVLAQVIIDGDDEDAEDKIDAVLETVKAAAAAAETEGFEIVMGGETSIMKQSDDLAEQDFGRIMMVTLVLGLVILLIAFRAVVAAVIPLVLALGSIFAATAVAAIVSQAYPLADVYGEMILLMGMAVGIDYSLFIVSRFRSERKAGRPRLEAIAVASNTTGRAVFYAGATVVLSLAGLALTNSTIFISLAGAAIIVVLFAIVGSLTLLPALLGILGDNVNRLRVPVIGRETKDTNGGGIWSAISDRVLKRPGLMASLTAAILVAAALPVTSLNLGFNSGSDAFPDAVEGKRALELLEEHFTSGLAAPAMVVVDAPDVNSPGVQASVASLIESADGDDAFFGPYEVTVNPAGDLLYVQVPVVGTIDDELSEDAVKHLRQDLVPAAFVESGANVYVTGQTAGSMDFRDHMYNTAPYVFAFVLGLAFLLLLLMFRSIVIPFTAIGLNLLSAGAAYGVLVMVFQWGWGISLLNAEATGVVESWLPLFLFGILFGLSMDYHMLLLSRIKEAHDEGRSNEESVSTGIKLTAGQITSAAAIMVGVFGSFALGSEIGMKQFGLGLGVAVLIDATVIRSVLLPATMKVLGEWNWYLPNWLEWLPKVGTEGDTPQEPATALEPGYAIPSMQPAPDSGAD